MTGSFVGLELRNVDSAKLGWEVGRERLRIFLMGRSPLQQDVTPKPFVASGSCRPSWRGGTAGFAGTAFLFAFDLSKLVCFPKF